MLPSTEEESVDTLVTPAGPPPFDIPHLDEGSIQSWAQACVEKVESSGRVALSLDALEYWLCKNLEPEDVLFSLRTLRKWNRLYRQ